MDCVEVVEFESDSDESSVDDVVVDSDSDEASDEVEEVDVV